MPARKSEPAHAPPPLPEQPAKGASSPDVPDTISPARVIEALLFASDAPLPPARIAQVLEIGTAADVRQHICALNQRYEQTGAAFRIEEIAGGYQMLTLPEFDPWIRRLHATRNETRLSAAALETLAIIAYKQPIVRAEIEAIRGVSVGEVLARLREMGLIKVVGRAEDIGRPMLYGTTKRFLEVFGLASLEDLPSVESLRLPDHRGGGEPAGS